MKSYRLTKRIKREVAEYAGGSLYRMNASSADCYAFSVCKTSKGKLDFEGGWDWSTRLVDKDAEWLYMLTSGKFIKI